MNLRKINLRKKHNANGTTTLYLEYYFGFIKDTKGKTKLKRTYEFFNPAIQIITEPKNAEERKQNKELLEIANNILKSKEIESLKDNFDFTKGKSQRINFIDYFSKVLNERDIKESTQLSWKSTINHLLNYCNPDTTSLNDIDENFIKGFRDFLNKTEVSKTGRKLHNNTKTTYFNILKIVMNKALKEGIITKNPFSNLKTFNYQESQRQYLTLEELEKLTNTECNKAVDKQAFLFACYTGIRYSDIQVLKWNQIINESGKYKVVFRQKKTEGFEHMPLNKQAIRIIGKPKESNELVFKGLYYNNNLNNNISNWCYKAGIKKHITFHSARHTFATLLLNNGGNIYTVSKLLGHKQLSTTEIYTKIIDKTKQETVNIIPEFKH